MKSEEPCSRETTELPGVYLKPKLDDLAYFQPSGHAKKEQKVLFNSFFCVSVVEILPFAVQTLFSGSRFLSFQISQSPSLSY